MRKRLLIAASLACTVWGTAPAKAEVAPTVASTASPAAAVLVRAGAHPDFDRVVFDWPRDVKFDVKQDGATVRVVFDTAGNLQFTRDVAQHLSRARGFSQSNDATRVTVTFTVAAGATIKSFTSGSSVVLDISGKEAPAADSAAPQPAAKEQSPKAAAAKPATAPEQKTDTKAKTKIEISPELEPLPPATPAPKAAPKVETKPEIKPQPAPEPKEEPKAEPKPEPPVQAEPAVAPPPVAPPAAAPVAPPPAPVAAPAPVRKSPPPPDIDLSGAPVLVATLDPHMILRTAVYQRGGYGYIVFENKLTLSAETLANGTPLKVALVPLDLPRNSGFRFVMPLNGEIRATLDGTAWKIYLSKPQAAPPVSSTLIPQPDFPLGARLLLPLPDTPEPLRLTDPVVGDELIIVPLSQSQAFNVERRLADFIILPAAQGLVIKPYTDRLLVRTISDGIEITAEGGLQLSRAYDTGASQQSAARAKTAAAGKSIFDFATWAGKQNETFTQTRQRLQQTIVDVPEIERNRARLELARFYFANGYGAESASLLNVLTKQMPDLRAHADFLALVGAAQVLANRPDDGLRELTSPQLAGQPEIDLWQAIALGEIRDWRAAEEKFVLSQKLLAGYPEPFYSRFSILAVEAALAVGKDNEAAEWLEAYEKSPHPITSESAIAYLHGALHAKAGRAAAAEKSWRMAAAGKDRLYKIRAELALIDLAVSTGSLTPAQAADRLEALRFAWRGDDLEVDILRRLGEFYIQARNVKAGLNNLAQATALYPTSAMAPAIRNEMSAIFRDVYLGDLGKKLSSLDALTLYQQYRDLMPTGADGDAVLRNLSERLVAIDLLDQAASLLDDLVKNRLHGEDKYRAAMRLAGIRLLDHKPEAAVAALDTMNGEGAIPADMQNERTLLRSRALSEMHRDAEATALLKDNPSQGAKLLRADIAMRAHDWDGAANALLDLVGPPESGVALSPEKAESLVNAAIAYALANNQGALDRVAIDYSAGMANTKQYNMFRMLTQPEKTGQLRDLSAAQAQLTQVDLFQNILNSYRAKPPK